MQQNKSLVDAAKKYLGLPYQWGGYASNGEQTALDCSGLVQASMCQIAKNFPRAKMHSQRMYHWLLDCGYCTVENEVTSEDILFFGKDINNITHCAIAVNWYTMIEAAYGGKEVLTLDDAVKKGAFVLCTPVSRRSDLVAILRLI